MKIPEKDWNMNQGGNNHNRSKDNQALLQSMLQRLKLQPGREVQSFPEAPPSVTVASTWGQGGRRGEPNLQNANNSSVNGFQFAEDKGKVQQQYREVQQPRHCEVDGGLTSFPSHKGNTDEDLNENRVLGPTMLPHVTSTEGEKLLPVRSQKDADISSFKSSVMGHAPGGEDAVKVMGPNQEHNQGDHPKAYMWSLTSTGGSPEVQGEVNEMGNGDSEESKDVQCVTSSPITNSSSLRRKQRSSENRTRRWTQKIKERWRDKHGSFSKKGKEGGDSMAQKSEQVSPQNKPLTGGNMITPPLKEEERTLPSLDNSDPRNIPPAHTENSSTDGRSRSYSDFEFGLGSFSLLEEITMGQEWAKFLKPNLSATSVNQSPSEDPLSQYKVSPNSYVQSTGTSSQQGEESNSNQWSCWRTRATTGSNLGLVQVSPDGPLPVSMEVSESKQQESVHRRADLSEPMDDVRMQPAERGLGRQHRPPSVIQPAGILDNSRAPANRKRQHQSSEKGVERLQTDKGPHAESTAAPSPTSSQEMSETEGTQRHVSLYNPQSPTLYSPFALVPRGVLKHSISQDSEGSMETMSKRRRVEENRRVRFSEDVMAIEPQDVDSDAFDSEDDSGGEEVSVTEQEREVEQAPVEEATPARRHALPAWILALKRRKNR